MERIKSSTYFNRTKRATFVLFGWRLCVDAKMTVNEHNDSLEYANSNSISSGRSELRLYFLPGELNVGSPTRPTEERANGIISSGRSALRL